LAHSRASRERFEPGQLLLDSLLYRPPAAGEGFLRDQGVDKPQELLIDANAH